jgi:beta-lactamase class A
MRRFLAIVLLMSAAAFVSGVKGGAATMTEADAIRVVLTANAVPADIFAASFLAQVPISQIIPIREQVTAPLGVFQRVDGANGQYTAYYTHGTVKVFIHLDTEGKIDGLLLRNPVIIGGNLDDAVKPFKDLPGVASYAVMKNGREIASYNADKALGAASTFKLAVLNALRKQINSKKRHWSDVVTLQPSWKSFPSGVLQSWPDNAPLTIATLATEMISISDNTAADSLIHIVGRDAIRPYGGSNVPFLTTREMFQIKSKNNVTLRARYRAGNAQQRAAVVSELDTQPLPDIAQVDQDPALSDIEWHFNNRQLCALMQGVADLPLMSVNPGLASPSQWKRIAYKGGSDWGVISMTTWLVAKNGDRYCVSASWNDSKAAVAENTFSSIYTTVLATLAGMK